MKLRMIQSLLPSKFQYLETKDGKVDYIGQMIAQLSPKIDLLPQNKPIRLPSETKYLIWPFTSPIRGLITDTTITQQIVALDKVPKQQHPPLLQKILQPVGIELEWEQ